MNSRPWFTALVLTVAVSESLIAGAPDEKMKKKSAAPTEKEMMESWMKAATPGRYDPSSCLRPYPRPILPVCCKPALESRLIPHTHLQRSNI